MKKHLQLRNRIKEMRLAKGLSQTTLAKKCYVSQNTISSLETGQYSPSAYTSGLLCIALGCKWEELFYYVFEEVTTADDVLDKIKTEIEEKGFNSPLMNPVFTLSEIIDIIDKYKAESEVDEIGK